MMIGNLCKKFYCLQREVRQLTQRHKIAKGQGHTLIPIKHKNLQTKHAGAAQHTHTHTKEWVDWQTARGKGDFKIIY